MDRAKRNYVDLDTLPGETVWIRDMKIWGTVLKKADTTRSYLIETSIEIFPRNKFHLNLGHLPVRKFLFKIKVKKRWSN